MARMRGARTEDCQSLVSVTLAVKIAGVIARVGPLGGGPKRNVSIHLETRPRPGLPRQPQDNPLKHRSPGIKTNIFAQPGHEPIKARRAVDWPWSSAQAHCAGFDKDNLLCIDRWQHLFGNPETMASECQNHLEDRIAFDRTNFAKECQLGTGSRHNRPHIAAAALTTGAHTGPAPPAT